MIIKKQDKLIEIKKLEAMARRISDHHSAIPLVISDLKKKQTEITGEKQVDFPLGFLDEETYFILHNVRLEDANGFFQMDTLLLSECYFTVLEVKNWQGTIRFGENGQVTRRTPDHREEGFQNPIFQVKTQVYRLQKWLRNHGFPQLPIYHYVVISSPSTIIENSSSNTTLPKEVIHNNELFFKMKRLEEKNHKKTLSREQLEMAAYLLKEKHVPLLRNLLKDYMISREDLLKGVFCPFCASLPMKRRRQQWHCQACGHYSKFAHYAALNDYFLLIHDQIANREARDFLKVESRDVMKRLLSSGGYQLIGKTKNSTYKLVLKEEDSNKNRHRSELKNNRNYSIWQTRSKDGKNA